MKSACVTAAAGLANVTFENPVPYAQLPERIRHADLVLGVFGTTPKAGRVIPNKVYQALASGRPIITRASVAYPVGVRDSSAVVFVPPGDPGSLAAAVAAWAEQRARLPDLGQTARAAYDANLSAGVIRKQLEQSLDALMENR